MTASINGIALHAEGEQLDEYTLRERAYSELLRQQAVQVGLLAPSAGTQAPLLSNADRLVLENMVDAAVHSPQPSDEECQRYYLANLTQYVVGQAVHVRHILFAVTPGVNVHALTVRAEKALLELLAKEAPADHFATLAAQLSNSPTATHGGDWGWVQAQDCAPELANELFHQSRAGLGLGVHPRLIHTRFGFHIIQVLGLRKGKQASYEDVRERVVMQLTMQSRAKALHQYMRVLAGQAVVEGIALDAADSLLMQ